jgi:hypothetical protein
MALKSLAQPGTTRPTPTTSESDLLALFRRPTSATRRCAWPRRSSERLTGNPSGCAFTEEAAAKGWNYFAPNPFDPSDIRAESFRLPSDILPKSEGLIADEARP